MAKHLLRWVRLSRRQYLLQILIQSSGPFGQVSLYTTKSSKPLNGDSVLRFLQTRGRRDLINVSFGRCLS